MASDFEDGIANDRRRVVEGIASRNEAERHISKLEAERDALKSEAEVAQSFHNVAVAERNLAWYELKELRELAGELVTYIEDHAPTDDATLDIETDALLARAAALGVEGAKHG